MGFLRFAVATTPEFGGDAFEELRSMLRGAGLEIEPVFVPNYVALYETVHLHAADAAWCPPLVARDLVRVAAAIPVATVLRGGLDHYCSAIVTHEDSPVRHISQVPSARVGWVSRLSAAGYVVPRDYLRSLGIDVASLDDRLFHTHGRVIQALLAREVDVIATYASAAPNGGKFFTSPLLGRARILGVAGQIPGDVIVVTRPDAHRDALADALRAARVAPGGPLAAVMNASGFGHVPADHLDSLARWMERSAQASFRFVARAYDGVR